MIPYTLTHLLEYSEYFWEYISDVEKRVMMLKSDMCLYKKIDGQIYQSLVLCLNLLLNITKTLNFVGFFFCFCFFLFFLLWLCCHANMVMTEISSACCYCSQLTRMVNRPVVRTLKVTRIPSCVVYFAWNTRNYTLNRALWQVWTQAFSLSRQLQDLSLGPNVAISDVQHLNIEWR